MAPIFSSHDGLSWTVNERSSPSWMLSWREGALWPSHYREIDLSCQWQIKHNKLNQPVAWNKILLGERIRRWSGSSFQRWPSLRSWSSISSAGVCSNRRLLRCRMWQKSLFRKSLECVNIRASLGLHYQFFLLTGHMLFHIFTPFWRALPEQVSLILKVAVASSAILSECARRRIGGTMKWYPHV